MKIIRTLGLTAAMAVMAIPALAHDMKHDDMSGMDMKGMMGMHDMAGTVSAIDQRTSLVDVDAGGMKLKVHFPASALANVKAGDKITLHLSFTKP